MEIESRFMVVKDKRGGGVVKMEKGSQGYKYPVTRWVSFGAILYSVSTTVNNTVLHIWKLLTE